MALFRRKRTFRPSSAAPAIPPTDLSERPERGELEWGMPSKCPSCGSYGYLDHIDLIEEIMYQHCPSCWYKWTTTKAQIDASARRGG